MKKIVLLLMLTLFAAGCVQAAEMKNKPFGYDLEADINRNNPNYNKNKTATPTVKKSESNKQTKEVIEIKYYGDETEADWEKASVVYSNATFKSALNKYKIGNYSGALQELIAVTKYDSSNPLVYYYLAMAYTQVGNKDQAVKAYEKVMKLNSDSTLKKYSMKGRDCLVGGPTCANEPDDEDDKFVKSPYGNGFSDNLNKEIRQQQLQSIQKTINNKKDLEDRDLDKIYNYDRHKSEVDNENKVAVSDEEILSAVETLKKAGITISINPYQQNFVPNNEYAQLSMLLGNNGNNNNSNMMNMLPYMMNQGQNGQNLDPQIFQTMMMNSMIPDFTFNDKKDY